MPDAILQQYHFLTLWERFVELLVQENFGDYLDCHLTRMELAPGSTLMSGTVPKSLWVLEHLHHLGWVPCSPAVTLDTIFPRSSVIDPYGRRHPAGRVVFIGAQGYPDLPGVPFPAELLFELLTWYRSHVKDDGRAE